MVGRTGNDVTSPPLQLLTVTCSITHTANNESTASRPNHLTASHLPLGCWDEGPSPFLGGLGCLGYIPSFTSSPSSHDVGLIGARTECRWRWLWSDTPLNRAEAGRRKSLHINTWQGQSKCTYSSAGYSLIPRPCAQPGNEANQA